MLIKNHEDCKFWIHAFRITGVSRADLERLGFDAARVDDATMRKLADKMADDYCNQLFWSSLNALADGLGIPKVPDKKNFAFASSV